MTLYLIDGVEVEAVSESHARAVARENRRVARRQAARRANPSGGPVVLDCDGGIDGAKLAETLPAW